MSVYTELDRFTIDQFVATFDIGELVEFTGIEAGIENTNYRIQTINQGQITEYFLTLVEYGPDHPLQDFLDFTELLAEQGLPVPKPLHSKQGQSLNQLKGKPAILVPLVKGHHLTRDELSNDLLFELGETIAKLHGAAHRFSVPIKNSKNFSWWQSATQRYRSLLSTDEQHMLTDELEQLSAMQPDLTGLPMGVVHSDLFMDNVLIHNHHISGVIDFYNSAYDYLLFDLAVAANDWCIDDTMALIPQQVQALLDGYQSVRILTEKELIFWPVFLRKAALRFWLSRLDTRNFQQQTGGQFVGKDPKAMAHMLKLRRANR